MLSDPPHGRWLLPECLSRNPESESISGVALIAPPITLPAPLCVPPPKSSRNNIFFPNRPAHLLRKPSTLPVYCPLTYCSIMAIDLIYPVALVILGGVATTKREFLPHAAGVVLVLLVLNTLRSSMFPWFCG